MVVQNGFIVPVGVTLLVVQDIAQQGDRFDIAAVPAQVLGSDHGKGRRRALVGHRRRGNGVGKRKDRGCYPCGKSVVAFGIRAAADVEVQAEIAAAIARNQLRGDFTPLRVIHMQRYFDGIQAVLHARQVRSEAHQLAVVGGNDFVDAVTEQKAAIHGRDTSLAHR